nr:sugar ABC transporter ATP-binding protein [Rubrivivax pictus]
MIELRGIHKAFPGVKSLDGVDFSAAPGEIHALLGENGAGKSTLTKIIAGAYQPDAGTIVFDGAVRRWATPAEARRAGIAVIHQELQLFPELTVAQNVFLGDEPRNRWRLIDYAAMRRRTREALQGLGHDLDPDRPVHALSVADRQMVEIAKALVREARLLILDEPTAAISGREAERLFVRLRALRDRGVAIVYISHRLEEIEVLCDRLTVLKDGRLVGARPVADTPRAQMVAMMIGRPLADIYPPKTAATASAPVVLSVRGLRSAPRVHDVSFELRAGEVLGLGGLVGAGRTETAHAIFGSAPRQEGSVFVDGRPLPPGDVRAAIAAGIGHVTEDRKGEGLLMRHSMAANVSAPLLGRHARAGFIDVAAERDAAAEEIRRFRVAIPGPMAGVHKLSGGNQQKILLARWSRACRHVLILDEPTRGVDIGAKVEIYRVVRELAAAGIGVLVISSELPELIGLADRVVVLREGRSVGELGGAAVTEEAVMTLATMGPSAPALAA